jgi:hypothetical protein
MSDNKKIDTLSYVYLRMFGIRGRNSLNELRIAEVKGLKASQIAVFCKFTGLTIDHLATVLDLSSKQMNEMLKKGIIPAKEADILLGLAKIVFEFFRLYPDIQDFWLLFLASREDLNGRSALELCKTGIGRERVLSQIHKERDDYFKVISEKKKSRKPAKRITKRKQPHDLAIQDLRWKKAKEEVYRFVKEHPLENDFYDVIHKLPKHSDIHKQEAKGALVHMINESELIETPSGKIKVPDNN